MNSTPPPLPSLHSENDDPNSFSRQAAKASAIAPFLTIALAYGCSGLFKSNQDSSFRVLLLVLSLVFCLMIGGGFISGILALVCMKPGGRGTIVFRALAGMLISSLLLAIAVPNFLKARQQALANRKANAELQSASKDFRSEAVKALKEGRPADLTGFKRRLDETAETSTGEAAALSRGTSAYLKKLQSLQATYNRAASDLTNAHVLRSSDLTEREQLQPRKVVVQQFLNANDTIRGFLKSSDENFRGELVRQQVSPAAVSSALGEFRKSSAAQMPLILEIRKADTRMGEAMLSVLDLLDSNWGQWQYNSASGKLRFNSTTAVQRYNTYLQEIDSAREDQTAAQQKLAALVSQKMSMR